VLTLREVAKDFRRGWDPEDLRLVMRKVQAKLDDPKAEVAFSRRQKRALKAFAIVGVWVFAPASTQPNPTPPCT
jgi:hypothetical protein